MFSQEDLETYNRVQNAMEAQRQLEAQNRRRGRLARILATVFIILFLATAGGAGLLGYNVYWLNQNYLGLQARHAKVMSDYKEVVSGYEASIESKQALSYDLNRANRDIQTLKTRLVEMSAERDETITKSNSYVDSLKQQIMEERANASREIAERNERIAGYIQVNADLVNSVTGLESSVSRLESTNQSLSQENSSLTQRNNTLTQRNNALNREKNSLAQRNVSLESENRSLNGRISTLQSQLAQARARQVTIPHCSSNYYTLTGGKLSCVARNSSAFQATQSETSIVDLPYSGKTTLRINRSGELGSDRSMDILEHAVKTIEEYMGEPIPLKGNEIRLDFVRELGDDGDFAGVYIPRESRMEILERFVKEKPLFGPDHLAGTIAHELAHHYWHGEKNWLDEGAAEFLEDYYISHSSGQSIKAQQHDHCPVGDISSLEGRRYNTGDDGFVCNYSLGEGLFLDLYDNLSEEDFQSAFRRLYSSINNKIAGIHQVRQAFYPGSDWVQKIIDKWYGYRETPEAHWPDGSYLAYYTWQEDGKWWHKTDNDKPCALRISYNESTRQFRNRSYSLCQYTGEWDENNDLIVTIDGKAYRAVETRISRDPGDYGFSVRNSF